jgi:hypothetical protein
MDWRLGEYGNKFIGVRTEANSVKGAEAADFFFYCNRLIFAVSRANVPRFYYLYGMRSQVRIPLSAQVFTHGSLIVLL